VKRVVGPEGTSEEDHWLNGQSTAIPSARSCGTVERIPDGLENSIRIFEDLIVPKPQHPESLGIQPGCTFGIVFYLFCMLTTVEFDNDPALKANEIHNQTKSTM
jgi:hypothetical protein